MPKKKPTKKCPTCKGKGVVEVEETHEGTSVEVPSWLPSGALEDDGKDLPIVSEEVLREMREESDRIAARMRARKQRRRKKPPPQQDS